MPADPPIGRVGYVIQGLGHSNPTGSSREVRCNGCRTWFPARLLICPDCETARPGFNKHIRGAQLDRHLHSYAHTAANEPTLAPVTSNVDYPH